MPDLRTETLRESVEQLLFLTEAEAGLLASLGRRLASTKGWWGEEKPEERTVISCVQALGGRWRVKVFNAVGLINVGALQIAVEPKIPLTHLLYLFGYSGQFPRLNDDLVFG